MNSKKGLTNVMIATLAIIIALILVLSIWMIGTLNKAERGFDKRACENSIKAAITFADKITFQKQELACQTQEIEIDGDLNSAESKEHLAKAMYDCWDIFQKGEVQLFEEFGRYCVTCAHIDMRQGEGTMNNPLQYMARKKIPLSEETYWEYITNGLGSEFFASAEEQRIDTAQLSLRPDLYQLVFVYDRGESAVEQNDPARFFPGGADLQSMSYEDPVASDEELSSGIPLTQMYLAQVLVPSPLSSTAAVISYFSFKESGETWRSTMALTPMSEDSLEQLGCKALRGKA